MSVRPVRLPARAGNRAVIYLRQSTYKEESISLEVQEQSARAHCERQGYDVVAVEADPGVSGRSWKQRRGVQAALGAIEAGSADVVVVWRWSRLSRSRRDWAVAADQADLAGGRIESATEPNDATAAGRFARGVMTELSAFESERIGEQWEEARQHRVARGLPSTGGPRFGYQLADRAYAPDPDTGPLLAELYRMYLGGSGSAQLVRLLVDRGIPRGGRNPDRPWTYGDVMRILDAGFGAGLLVRTPPRPKGQPGAAAPYLPVWEREFRDGAHPAVIDRATWDAYVAARRARTTTRVPQRSHMLSGLVRCLECGGPMHHNSDAKGRKYLCSRATRSPGLRRVSVSARYLEADVEAWVLQLADDLAARRAAIEQTDTHAAAIEMTARRAQQMIEKADARLLKLTLRLADETISDAAYKVAAAALEAERADAEVRLAAARRNPAREAAPAALSPDLRRQWPSMTPEARNMILRPLIARIEVGPGDNRGPRVKRWRIVPTWEAETP